MAVNTAVNSQITDAVTQTNVEVIGASPAAAMGNFYQEVSDGMQNAAANEHQGEQPAPEKPGTE